MEPVPPGDLERDQPHLPRPGGDRQRALDPAHLEHVDGTGTERDGSPDRDRVDQPAVEIMGAVDLYRRQQPGHGARGHDRGHHRAVGEPARGRVLDAGRHALERQLQVGEGLAAEHLGQQPAQRLQRVQVRPRTHQPRRPSPQLLAERQPELLALPHPRQPGGRTGRVGRHHDAVDRPDRGAHHQVGPDARLAEGTQHADFVGAEEPSAPEHESRGHRGRIARPFGIKPPQPRRMVSPSDANWSNGRW